jgi:hypothetical protein
VEDFVDEDEEETEDTGTGFARTAGLMCAMVFARVCLTSVLGDDLFRLTDLTMCGRLEVGTGGGVWGVVLPMEVPVVPDLSLPALCLGVFCAGVGVGLWDGVVAVAVVRGSAVFLAMDSIISNFLAIARADFGRTGGGEPGKGGDGMDGGGACVFLAGLLVTPKFLSCLSCWDCVPLLPVSVGTATLVSSK